MSSLYSLWPPLLYHRSSMAEHLRISRPATAVRYVGSSPTDGTCTVGMP